MWHQNKKSYETPTTTSIQADYNVFTDISFFFFETEGGQANAKA